MSDLLKVGDRVRWRHNEPGASEEELTGVVVEVEEDEVVVRFDTGDEERNNDDDFTLLDRPDTT